MNIFSCLHGFVPREKTSRRFKGSFSRDAQRSDDRAPLRVAAKQRRMVTVITPWTVLSPAS